MNTRSTMVTYPAEGFAAPKDRKGNAGGAVTGLPSGTEVFSADDHISLAADIFYEKFPVSMKDEAPRVIFDDGAWSLTIGGKPLLPKGFTAVLKQYDPLRGAASNNVEGRIQEIEGKLSVAQIIDPSEMDAGGKVVFGSTIELEDEESGNKVTYQIVGEDEADIKFGRVNISSPIARALIGKDEGDSVEFQAPGGLKRYEIIAVMYL